MQKIMINNPRIKEIEINPCVVSQNGDILCLDGVCKVADVPTKIDLSKLSA